MKAALVTIKHRLINRMVARTSLNSLRQGVRGATVRLLVHLMIHVSICFAMIFTNTSMVKSRPFAGSETSCAAEAQKLFQEEGQDANINPLTSPIAPVSRRYQSHYNNILKKCLMLLEATQYGADQLATFVTLIDVDDRHLYAFYLYLWSLRKDKRGLQASPTMCELIPDFRTKIQCDARKEFDVFVARYMNE